MNQPTSELSSNGSSNKEQLKHADLNAIMNQSTPEVNGSASSDTEIAREWVEKCHETTATLNIPLWLQQFISPTCTIKFFKTPPLSGHDQISPVFNHLCSLLAGLDHDILLTEYVKPRVLHQCKVKYTFKSGDVVEEEVFAVWTMKETTKGSVGMDGEGKWFVAEKMEVFGDANALFAAMGRAEDAGKKKVEGNGA